MLQPQTPHDEEDDDPASDAGEDEGDGTCLSLQVPAVAHVVGSQTKIILTMTMTPTSRRKSASLTEQPSIHTQVCYQIRFSRVKLVVNI